MASQGHNEGFRVMDDFACEAIHAPAVPQADPSKQGQNEGVQVIQELVVDASEASPREEKEKDDDVKPRPDPSSEKELFYPMGSAAGIGGLIGSVIAGPLGAVIGRMLGGVICGLMGSTEALGATICKRCGNNKAEMRLDCCRSPVCSGCFKQMIEHRGISQLQFRCSVCGKTRSTTTLTEPGAAPDRPRE
jgi:hypothetical protein